MDAAGLRRKWFHSGATALAHIAHVTGVGDQPVYLCPQCFNLFDEGALDQQAPPGERLTIEHVPPGAVKGQALILTCGTCNHEAGTKVDAHAVAQVKHRESTAAGRTELDGRAEGVAVQAHVTSDSVLLYMDGSRTNPLDLARLKSKLDAGGQATFNFEFKLGWVDRKASLSYLRAAYFVLFARWGYRSIIGDAMAPVRQQLRDLDSTTLERLPVVFGENPAGLFVVAVPQVGSALAVGFGGYGVILPAFDADMAWWARLDAARAPGEPIRFDASREVEWPHEPMHELDWAAERPPIDQCVPLDL